MYNKELSEYERFKEEKESVISAEEKSLERKTEEANRLKEMKKNNINKINILDNENIDLEKVTHKVVEIFKEISHRTANENIEGSS